MKDCDKQIKKYYENDVKLLPEQNTQLTSRKEANRNRLRKGLKKNDNPRAKRFAIQGSRAMGTTIQEPDNAYDVDDGVVFSASDLVDKNGNPVTALSARKMVRDAVDDGSFKTEPSVKTNCVRIHYDDGPHVDQPVYRELEDGSLELAGADWKRSDPAGVTKWFRQRIALKVGENAPSQIRAIVRLMKAYCKNRPSYSLPSGFALTRLVEEAYSVSEVRLDSSFRSTIRKIHGRLLGDLHVTHPVVDEYLIDAKSEHKTAKLRDLLFDSLKELEILDSSACLTSKALKAWKKVFQCDSFDEAISAAETEEKRSSVSVVASLGAAVPKQWSS